MPIPHITTRRLMILVALSAAFLSGTHCAGPQPGEHFGLPAGGLRAGACRNGHRGPSVLHHGRRGSGRYQAGIWRAESPGEVVFGVVVEDGWACLYRGGLNPVVLW